MSDFDEISFDEDDFPTDFVTKNDDLEDSILGGLLKESSKQLGEKKMTNKQANLSMTSTKPFGISSKEDTSPSITIDQVSKKDVQKAANSMDDSDSFDVSFEDDECSYQPTTGAKRSIPTASPHRPSALQSSSRGPYTQAGGSKASAITVGPRTISETKGVTGRAQSSSTGADRADSTEDQSKEADQVTDIGFMPSFLEPDKQSRQKRNLGGSSSINSASGRLDGKQSSARLLDNLDIALGLSGRSGGSPSRPATANANANANAAANKFVDPFLNAGSVSSGTSLDRGKGQGQGPRARSQIESFDDSDGENDDNDFDDDDGDGDNDSHEEAPKSAGRGVASSYPASSKQATPHRTPDTGSNSDALNRSASESSKGSLPSVKSSYGLAGATSFPSPSERVKVDFPEMSEESDEDVLDVSGIVRVQSFETFQNISSGDVLGRQSDKEGKRGDQSSSSGSGKRAQVTGSVVESRAKVSSVTSSSLKRGQELEQERESLGSPAVRRDKAVSFEQSSSSPSPTALPVSKSFAAQSQRQHSPDKRLELGESADESSAARVAQLQHTLAQAQSQRESSERALRLEIDTLRAKVLAQSVGLGSSATDAASIAQLRRQEEVASNQLQEEIGSLRRTVSQLESKLARSAEEVVLRDLQHAEEIKYSTERMASELGIAERRKDEELRSIERRNADSVASLKQVHLNELQAVRDRTRDGVALDQLAGQIKQSSGSIKLLEENLNLRYKGLEAAREGQLEARERLLSEMELKARERVEAAEIESYRLKGLLVHMEHVAATLRGKGGEETERLRQEHHRLQVMQSSLESERQVLQARSAEDAAAVRQKTRDLEAEGRRLQEDRRAAEESALVERQRLEADRVDFAAHVNSASKAAEHGAKQLKEEEARLGRVRENLADQKATFEKKKQSAKMDIQGAEQARRAVMAATEHLERERAAFERNVRDFQSGAERLALREEKVAMLECGLCEREDLLRDGLAVMQSEAISLSRRESNVRDTSQVHQQHRSNMEEADRALTKKRIEAAAMQRSLSSRQAAASMRSLLPAPVLTLQADASGFNQSDRSEIRATTIRSGDVVQSREGRVSPSAGKGETDLLMELKRRPGLGAWVPTVEQPNPEVVQRGLEDSAQLSARQVLESVRSQLSRSSGARLEIGRLIEQESAFLVAMGKGKGAVGPYQ